MEMIVRKLAKDEHVKTRTLWEQVFAEDTTAFLDYYYKEKTSDNQIYVVEDQEKICSMLQLNPYLLHIGASESMCEYIIAVATLSQYRRKGIMAAILKKAMQDLREKNQPFVFLMPAKEAIYRPFDFRFVYEQKQCKVIGRCQDDTMWVRESTKEDCIWMAEFAEKVIGSNFHIYAKRDVSYYRRALKEQQSEDGGILVWGEGDTPKGHVLYAKGEGFELREPLCEEEQVCSLGQVVHYLTKDETTEVRVCAHAGKECVQVPIIMARILHLPAMLSYCSAMECLDFEISITDPILSENNKMFRVRAEAEGKIQAVAVGEAKERESLSIAALTSVLFGYKNLEDALDEEGDVLPMSVKEALAKIEPLAGIFLNEIV